MNFSRLKEPTESLTQQRLETTRRCIPVRCQNRKRPRQDTSLWNFRHLGERDALSCFQKIKTSHTQRIRNQKCRLLNSQTIGQQKAFRKVRKKIFPIQNHSKVCMTCEAVIRKFSDKNLIHMHLFCKSDQTMRSTKVKW